MDKEQYYDEHIAPKLFEIGKECEANGLSLLAVCEYGPGDYARTVTIQPGSSFAIRLTDTAAKSEGNVDRLMFALINHANKHGHNSLFLSRLGVPTQPTTEKD